MEELSGVAKFPKWLPRRMEAGLSLKNEPDLFVQQLFPLLWPHYPKMEKTYYLNSLKKDYKEVFYLNIRIESHVQIEPFQGCQRRFPPTIYELRQNWLDFLD